MLQNIRERSQGWVATLIFAVIALCFVLFGIQYYLSSRSGADSVATVNGQPVSKHAVESYYRRLSERMVREGGKPLSLEEQKTLRGVATKQLVKSAMVEAFLNTLGLVAPMVEINARIMAEPAFQENGHYSPLKFQRLLAVNGLSEERYIGRMQTDLIQGQFFSAIDASAFALPSEVEQHYRQSNELRSYGYFLLDPKLHRAVSPSTKVLKAYYQAHAAAYTAPAAVRLQYVLLSPEGLKRQVSVTDKAVHAYYEANKQNFMSSQRWHVKEITVKAVQGSGDAAMQKAKAAVDTIVKRLQDGVDFDAASKGVTSAKQSTRWVEMGTGDPAVTKILKTMVVDQMSVPVQTQSGYHLFYLMRAVPAHAKPYAKIKKSIRAMLLGNQLQRLFAKQSAALSNLAFTHPDTLAPAAKAVDTHIVTTGWFTRTGAKRGLAATPRIVQAAFSDAVFNQGNNSDLITLKDNRVVVLRVDRKRPAQLKTFATVKAAVEKAYRRDTAATRLKAQSKELLDKLKSGASPSKLAKAFHLKWHAQHDVSRYATGVDSAISALAFAAHKGVSTYPLADGKYLVLQMQSVKLPEKTALSAMQQQVVGEAVTADWQHKLKQATMDAIEDSTKVVYTKA